MSELLQAFNTLTLPEQFRAGAVLIACIFVLILAAWFCVPLLLAGARELFPDETLEDDEQRLVDARRRRRELDAVCARHGFTVIDAADERKLLEAIAHMPHPTNRIH